MKTLTLIFSLFLPHYIHAQCFIANELVTLEESWEGKSYVKVVTCEHDFESGKVKPSRCLLPGQLQRFLDRVKTPDILNTTVWSHLGALGFKDREDLNTKMKAYSEKHPGQGMCLSGELGSDKVANRKVRASADFIANLYNHQMAIVLPSGLPSPPMTDDTESKKNQGKNR